MKSVELKLTFKQACSVLVIAGALLSSVQALSATQMPGPGTEKLDMGTQGFLIEKLEAVLKATPAGDATRVPALLRLADLYSERARLALIKEEEAGCGEAKKEICGLSKNDRKLAIAKYEMALDESSGSMQSRILFQLAHLYELNGEDNRAAALYKKIIGLGEKHFSKVVLGQSQAGLGEIAFRENKFAAAKKDFEKALENKETPRRGWIQYRLAWCDLNLDKVEQGKQRLLTILKTPSLLALDSRNPNKPDPTFQEDIARDLTVFLARTGFSQKDIATLWELSPAGSRKQILMALAEEAERTGSKRASIAVWEFIAQHKSKKRGDTDVLDQRERLEAQIRVAYLRFGLEEKKQAVADYQNALLIWKNGGCEPEAECALLQKRLRKLVLEWNKNEETALTPQLLAMYKLYVAQFKQDPEMAFWGANVARELKQNADAAMLYGHAARAAHDVIQSSKKGDLDKNIPTVFEGSLVTQIEMAELAKDLGLREKAYNTYLELNPKGEKALEVRYQLAQVAYQRGDHRRASDEFYTIATGKTCGESVSICKQSADLALDAMVLMKDDERLESWAIEFSKRYPKAQNEFMTIARRARLNIAAKAAEGKGSETENLKKLREMNLSGASREDVMLTYRNRFVLAEKTKNFGEAQATVAAILAYKGATAAEREDALEKQLWLAEMQLDFSTAYATAKKMEHKGSRADRELKLAMLAELAGQNSARGHLQNYIRETRDQKGALAARVKLVKLSGYSASEFNKHFDQLKKNPELLASIGLEVYSRKPSASLASKILSVKRVSKTAEGAHLARIQDLPKLESWARQLSRATLPHGASDKTLQRALAARIKTLNEADRFTNKMIATGDGWLQAASLQVVANENRRLKEEILALPMPKGLKADDQKRYMQLINAQVAPFEQKAARIDRKLSSFWLAEASMVKYTDSLSESKGAKRSLLMREARVFATMAPPSVSNRLIKAIDTDSSSDVRVSSVESAREDVRRNPYDLGSLRELRKLEAARGSETMVVYLDKRMSRMGGQEGRQ